MNFDKDVSGKNIIIVDDLISSGTTMVKAAKLLKKEGAKEIYAISTHGLFVGNSKKELGKSRITKIIVSNTLSIKSSRQIEVVGVNKFII